MLSASFANQHLKQGLWNSNTTVNQEESLKYIISFNPQIKHKRQSLRVLFYRIDDESKLLKPIVSFLPQKQHSGPIFKNKMIVYIKLELCKIYCAYLNTST